MLKKIFLLWLLVQNSVNAQDSIPEQITVPAGNRPVLSAHAQGDQIYQCVLNEGRYSWKLKAPDTDLFDTEGRLIGRHYEGPTWEYKDGSRVVGRVVDKIDIEPGSAISWLLVEAIAHKRKGIFADVNFINRINTHGGLPPLEGCDSNHPGSEKRVAYVADYIFYAPE
ncbi:DUF3455 domain-containing protein [Candidatus Methylobacter favarea]|nr:DUF3455 domain-containing protein [Candidatus Methylobacter favarea]